MHHQLYVSTSMPTLQDGIAHHTTWIIKAFAVDRMRLDYTVRSVMEIDKYFQRHARDGKPLPGGRLQRNIGHILYCLGVYTGEVVVKQAAGSRWNAIEDDPEGEFHAQIILPDGQVINPMQAVWNRFKKGDDQALYPQWHALLEPYTQEPFDESFFQLIPPKEEKFRWTWW